MTPVGPVDGKSNSGKTTLLGNAVREIKLKGYRFIRKEELGDDIQYG